MGMKALFYTRFSMPQKIGKFGEKPTAASVSLEKISTTIVMLSFNLMGHKSAKTPTHPMIEWLLGCPDGSWDQWLGSMGYFTCL